MSPLLQLVLFLAGGMIAARVLSEPGASLRWARLLNRWVIRAALPSLVLLKIHSLREVSLAAPEVLLPISQPWFHFFLSLVVVSALARLRGWKRQTWGALVLTVGLGNTSFVGLPLLRALLGPESLATGVLLDQLGSFLILAAIGAPFAQTIAGARDAGGIKRAHWAMNLLRPFQFPPFLALVAGLAFRGTPVPFLVSGVLTGLSATLAPAALISVGLSMRLRAIRKPEVREPLLVGLGLKLAIFPIIHWFVYSNLASGITGFPPLVLRTILLESCMASMITAGVVAAENELHAELAQLMVGVSILLSLVTVPLWAMIY